jgi:hypothetical protein
VAIFKILVVGRIVSGDPVSDFKGYTNKDATEKKVTNLHQNQPHSLLLTPCPLLLTAPHSSRLTPHSSLLTPHSSLLTPHSSLLTPHSSLLTPHSSLLTHFSSSVSLLLLIFQILRNAFQKGDAWFMTGDLLKRDPVNILTGYLVLKFSSQVSIILWTE